jgi:hypothetical protein
MKSDSPTLPRRRPSASIPAGPTPENIAGRPVAELDEALATVKALTDCTLEEAIVKTRVAYRDAEDNWQYWYSRADNQVALDIAVTRLDMIGAVQRRLNLIASQGAPLIAAEAVQDLRPDEQDTLPLEVPESQALPMVRESQSNVYQIDPTTHKNALRRFWSEARLLGLEKEDKARRKKRITCLIGWIGHYVSSASDMTAEELISVSDAMRRGDIGGEWEILTDATWTAQQFAEEFMDAPRAGEDEDYNEYDFSAFSSEVCERAA